MFRLRGIKKRNIGVDLWYDFEFKDCPTLAYEDCFFLAGKVDTPLMYYDSIVRGHPTIDMFEGDLVFDKETDERIGTIVYYNGFKMKLLGEDVLKNISTDHIYLRRGNRDSIKEISNYKRTPIMYKVKSMPFNFRNTVKVKGQVLHLVVRKEYYKVLIHNVSELLYENDVTGETVFSGEMVCGKFISLDNIATIERN